MDKIINFYIEEYYKDYFKCCYSINDLDSMASNDLLNVDILLDYIEEYESNNSNNFNSFNKIKELFDADAEAAYDYVASAKKDILEKVYDDAYENINFKRRLFHGK